MKTYLSKDDLRVQRSIESITKKINASLCNSYPLLVQREKEFEKQCINEGLIYFPKFINLYI